MDLIINQVFSFSETTAAFLILAAGLSLAFIKISWIIGLLAGAAITINVWPFLSSSIPLIFPVAYAPYLAGVIIILIFTILGRVLIFFQVGILAIGGGVALANNLGFSNAFGIIGGAFGGLLIAGGLNWTLRSIIKQAGKAHETKARQDSKD